MFRKPKGINKKRFIKKSSHSNSNLSNSDSNSEDENICLSKGSSIKKSSNLKKRLLTSNTEKKRKLLHEYNSGSSELMTGQDMATRMAEHHPLQPSSKNNTKSNNSSGPMRAPTFFRATCRFDYQPDVCKDYKETGFCGFGDTCIYLHDRGDTLAGWQLDQKWEEQKKLEQQKKEKQIERFMVGAVCEEIEIENNIELDVVDVPFACHICRGPFKEPIVTSCNHYFCESCIMKRFHNALSSCPICSKDTEGVFNYPQKLYAKKKKIVGVSGTWNDFMQVCTKKTDTNTTE